MQLTMLLSWLLVLSLVTTATTERREDPVSSGCLNLTRVEKKALVTYTYTLNQNNKWAQFPDMFISFYLPLAQYVQIKYNIQTMYTGTGTMVTRVKIDGR